jgi:hypothetical protein
VTGRALVVRGDALQLPLPDACADLIITSPPYFALRAYNAGPGELGSEPTPALFLEALWAATHEMVRVLKPSGSIFVNLGDLYAANERGPDGSSSGLTNGPQQRPGNARRANAMLVRRKSLLGLPWAYALGATGMLAALGGPAPALNLILRAEICWSKPNGLPESVTDRVRRSHESWFHFVRQPRYYAAVDEVREPYAPSTLTEYYSGRAAQKVKGGHPSNLNGSIQTPYPDEWRGNPLGKLPGSVWSIPSEPLDLPGYFTLRDGRLLDFLAPGRGGRRPRPNGHHPGLFDPDAYSEVLASGDGSVWRWLRATGINRSPWPQDDTALQLRVAASHYAAFPSAWPRQLILGWSPPGICVECGQGRVPVVDRRPDASYGQSSRGTNAHRHSGDAGWGMDVPGAPVYRTEATILGYACACTPYTDHPGTGEDRGPEFGHAHDFNGYPNHGISSDVGGPTSLANRPKVGPWREYHLDGWRPPPTRPTLVLDPFGGTGTVAMVARALGRHAVTVDLSHAYSRAARWRITSDNAAKAISRTNAERQGSLL